MNKVLFVFLASLMMLSLVAAGNGNSVTGNSNQGGLSQESNVQAQQSSGFQASTELQAQNQGQDVQLQNRVKVQAGSYTNQEGRMMRIHTGQGNEISIQSGNIEARIAMNMTQSQVQNRTMLRARLSNGREAEVKVMPDTASQRAIERLRLKVCSAENECQLELKEVGNGEQAKMVYEIKAQKEIRVLGIFETKMNVRAQVDAESGEILQASKPWWAFLASE